MRKIGIFGSSFNPIHIGHLIFAEQARLRLDLDYIMLIPTYNPYHKNVDLLEFKHRYNMTKNTVEDNKNFIVSDIEKTIEGNSYSYNLLKKMKELEDADYYFIIGSDSLENIFTWYNYQNFVKMVKLVVFERPKHVFTREKLNEYEKKLDIEIIYFDDLQIQISSTFIREQIKLRKYPKYLLPEVAMRYIKENSLWI